MFAGGVPLRSPSNPVDCVLAALELARVVKEMAETGPVTWQLRIGVNTGPVIAGVVGIKKFAFDIWGEAVNFSARMEACGRPGMVNLSANTYARVKDFFECEKQEKVRVKEGREVDTYLVKDLSSRLAKNKTGASPREAFAHRYRAYFRKELEAFPDFLGGSSRQTD
jgi:adenylate cyclase